MAIPATNENFGYNATVMDHFQNPRNAGEIENPSCVGVVRNSECGDLLKLYLKIEDGRIADAKFKTYGCAAAIASSSMLTVLLIGRRIEDAAALTSQDVADALGGLPERKVHAALLAQEGIRAALAMRACRAGFARQNSVGRAPLQASNSTHRIGFVSVYA